MGDMQRMTGVVWLVCLVLMPVSLGYADTPDGDVTTGWAMPLEEGKDDETSAIPPIMAGWDPLPSDVYARTMRPDANLGGVYFGGFYGHHWLTGQLQEIFRHGGFAFYAQLGVMWELWWVGLDTEFTQVGNGHGEKWQFKTAVGLVGGRRVMLSSVWGLNFGLGWHYNWAQHCEDASSHVSACDNENFNFYFRPEGHSFNIDLGLVWTWVRESDETYRVRGDVLSTVRVTALMLDNAPAERSIEGMAVIWTLGSTFDFAWF